MRNTWLRTLIPLVPAILLAGASLSAQQATAVNNRPPSAESSSLMPNWLRLGGEYRARFEGFTDGGFKDGNNDAYVLSRFRLNMQIQPTPWMKFMVQGQDSHVFWKNQHPAAPPFQDIFDLRQGYLELGDTEKKTFGLRIGRQELNFGEQRLVGSLDWTNTARTFDSVRGTFHIGPRQDYRIDLFAASVVNQFATQFDRATAGNNLYGLYASLPKLIPKSTLEPYVFWRRAAGQRTETGTPGLMNFGTVGMRWVGQLPAGFDYGTEIAGQDGHLGSDRIGAWAGHWMVGHTAVKSRFQPRLVAEFNYASGDHNLHDGRRGTFDQLYPTGHNKYGLADQVGWRNIEDLRLGVEVRPHNKWQVLLYNHNYWLADADDGLYNAAGILVVRVPNGSAGRRVGQELDLQTVYALSKRMTIAAGYAHLFPGEFLKHATPGKPYNYPFIASNFVF